MERTGRKNDKHHNHHHLGSDPACHLHEQGDRTLRISAGAGGMQQSIWTRGEFPFLKCGFAAQASVVTDQTDKVAFSKCRFQLL